MNGGLTTAARILRKTAQLTFIQYANINKTAPRPHERVRIWTSNSILHLPRMGVYRFFLPVTGPLAPLAGRQVCEDTANERRIPSTVIPSFPKAGIQVSFAAEPGFPPSRE